jgi:hypothetical protein
LFILLKGKPKFFPSNKTNLILLNESNLPIKIIYLINIFINKSTIHGNNNINNKKDKISKIFHNNNKNDFIILYLKNYIKNKYI